MENIINHLFLARVGGFAIGGADRIASEDVQVEVPEILNEWSEQHQELDSYVIYAEISSNGSHYPKLRWKDTV